MHMATQFNIQALTSASQLVPFTFCLCLSRLLGVAVDASQAEIKSAYRKAALKLHPDVSDAPDATEQFTQLSSAYGELS